MHEVQVEQQLQFRQLIANLPDPHCVTSLIHHRLGIGVVEQVNQFIGLITIVDVDGTAANLESTKLGLQILGGIVQIQANLAVRAESVAG